jgi:hypothetical protein
VGNAHLKIHPDRITEADLLQAQQHFQRAFTILKSDPSTTPKQAARIYQKLMETCLALSQITRDLSAQRTHAEDAKQYGTSALQNVKKVGDACMIAQIEFLVACVETWSVYIRSTRDRVWDITVIKDQEAALVERLSALQQYPNLNLRLFEEKAKKFLRYMERLTQDLA